MSISKRKFLKQFGSAIALAGVCADRSLARPAFASQSPIRIGQIGMTHGHANKLVAYRNSPDYEVVGVVEENNEAYSKRSSDPAFAGLPRISREELLATERLQAVLIESEICDLLKHAKVCLESGLHIHLDKPAGESYSEFEEVIRIARQKSLMLQLGYMYRYNPAVVLLRDFVAKNWLGEIFEIHAVMSKKVGRAERELLRRYPGGMMFELGCHLIDIITSIMGEPEQVTAHKSHSSQWNDNLWDNMLAVLQYPNAIVSVKSSCLEVDGGNRRHLVVCGSKGTFHIEPLDNPRVRLTLEEPVGDYEKGTHWLELPKYSRYVDDAAEMAAVLRGSRTFPFSYDHDLITQKTILRASGVLG